MWHYVPPENRNMEEGIRSWLFKRLLCVLSAVRTEPTSEGSVASADSSCCSSAHNNYLIKSLVNTVYANMHHTCTLAAYVGGTGGCYSVQGDRQGTGESWAAICVEMFQVTTVTPNIFSEVTVCVCGGGWNLGHLHLSCARSSVRQDLNHRY